VTDVVVIGAGVVGLACAAQLAARDLSVLVLERHQHFGTETSSRNSEVIHSGIYYTPDSLKARYCVEGNALMYDFCRQHDVAHKRTGKLIVAVAPEEEAALDTIHQRAQANGVPGLRRLGPAQITDLEPAVRGAAALFSESTGVVDSHGFMATLERMAESHGAQFAYQVELVGATRTDTGHYELEVIDVDGQPFSVEAAAVVNAAGLDADRVAALPGLDVDALGYRQHYCAGHYYRLAPRLRNHVSHLIYPVPEKRMTGLGIHVTVDVAGDLRLGPDAEYRQDREQDYRFRGGGRAEAFHSAVSRFLDGVALEDLVEDQVGIRPKLQGPGDPYRDFVVSEEDSAGLPGWVNLIGIESPGLTCALVIAREVDTTLASRT
jgi:L-2-hydroxyglutarate oxidase LhgO